MSEEEKKKQEPKEEPKEEDLIIKIQEMEKTIFTKLNILEDMIKNFLEKEETKEETKEENEEVEFNF